MRPAASEDDLLNDIMALVIELKGERLGGADCAVWILSKPQDGG